MTPPLHSDIPCRNRKWGKRGAHPNKRFVWRRRARGGGMRAGGGERNAERSGSARTDGGGRGGGTQIPPQRALPPPHSSFIHSSFLPRTLHTYRNIDGRSIPARARYPYLGEDLNLDAPPCRLSFSPVVATSIVRSHGRGIPPRHDNPSPPPTHPPLPLALGRTVTFARKYILVLFRIATPAHSQSWHVYHERAFSHAQYYPQYIFGLLGMGLEIER
mmetsp:Transcript_25195/g.73980  ORF Transcript_25195/g.73980 Transcript_25195/m.73980 type:complete len:217 (-) Transcript_25195:4084-4734(-)